MLLNGPAYPLDTHTQPQHKRPCTSQHICATPEPQPNTVPHGHPTDPSNDAEANGDSSLRRVSCPPPPPPLFFFGFKTVSRCRHVYNIITNTLTPHAMTLTAQYIHAHPSHAMRMLCQAVQCIYMAVSVS